MLKIAVKGSFDEVYKIIKQLTQAQVYNLDKENPSYCDIVIISEYTEKIPPCRFIISECIALDDIPNEPYLVTCGTDSLATLTISSYTDILCSNIQCCIQRTIYTLNGNEIDRQEFSLESGFKNINILLASVAAALINDVDINIIKKRLLKSINNE